ncbi:globin domain-containing protein [Cellulomonas sp. 179-A 4D5 NHS]|uniref:globin domain-containing protein n=1 Tax=Cellulomonas sp. 179-A 4D5 NHS TaxID=3142378 RepID=UPI0039A013F9
MKHSLDARLDGTRRRVRARRHLGRFVRRRSESLRNDVSAWLAWQWLAASSARVDDERQRGTSMLSDRARPVVTATLPLVAENIPEIARRFYAHMFAARPDLLDGLFNRGNQAEGTQQIALAGSVAAFASALIRTPEELPEQLMSRVAHKHASLGIRPDHYPIVHEHLFWAIVDVLGDAVTAEVAAAWDEVYWLMAYALINQERGLYSARGVRPETVWRQWQVVQRIQETADVVTFRVQRIDRRSVRTSLPGQYVTVKVPMPDGVHQPRQYSLTRADDGEHRQFSVRRVHRAGHPDGEVSTYLCRSVHVGDLLTLSVPFGDVVMDDSGRPLVFISAGIGITPMAGMLSHLVAAGSHLEVHVLHADAAEETFALRYQVLDDLRHLPNATIHVWYENSEHSALAVDGVHTGLLDLADVTLPDGAGYYLCGPLPFMKAVRNELLERGVPPRAIQYEVFGPDLWQADLIADVAPDATHHAT